MFRAEHFDPNAWVDLFASAGARYIVPVAEHCDGFAMYDSAIHHLERRQDGPASRHRRRTRHRHPRPRPPLRRILPPRRALVVVRRRPHLRLRRQRPALRRPLRPRRRWRCPAPPTHTKEPDPSHFEQWLPPDQAFLDDWLARSTELVDKYHPDFFYFDWWIGQPAFQPYLQQFAAYYYNRNAAARRQPEAVLTYKIEAMPANTATLDIERGKLDTLRLLPWQTDTSITIHSWGYVEHDEYRDAKSLIHQLVDTVSKNGNLLLNVGPKSDGTIPEEAKAVLLQMGDWLKVNGEAIYGTRPFTVFGEGPTKAGKNSTAKNSDIQTYTAEDIRFTTARRQLSTPSRSAGPPADAPHPRPRQRPSLPQGQVCSVDLLGSERTPIHSETRRNLPHPPRAETQRHRLRLPHSLRTKCR